MTAKRLHCLVCSQVTQEQPGGVTHCSGCGSPLHHRRRRSLVWTQALTLAAAIMLIPANFLPVMTVQVLGRGTPSTILEGVITLWQEGLWAIGAIVMVASFAVPFGKLAGLGLLILTARGHWPERRRQMAILYRVLVAIGRWSMLDVFLVVFLTGLVQLGVLASVTPGLGVVAFGISVVLTLLATDAFDPRLLWDGEPRPHGRRA